MKRFFAEKLKGLRKEKPVSQDIVPQKLTFTTACAAKCTREKIEDDDPKDEKLRKIIMNGDTAKTVGLHGLDSFLSQVKFSPIYTVRMPAFDQTGKHVDDQLSPFLLSIAMQNSDIFELIMSSLPTVTDILAETPTLGNNALHIAASRNNAMFNDIWDTYSGEGAAVDTPNNSGQTPLMFATRFCAVRNVRFIMENSDFNEINAKDSFGKTAVDYAHDYYVPGEATQRVARELAKRSGEVVALFVNAQTEKQRLFPYLAKVEPYAPDAIRSLETALRNSNKRISSGNVNALINTIVNDKNSALYTSSKTNTSAFKKLEKLAISLESKSNSTMALHVLIDVLKRKPSILPMGSQVSLQAGDNAQIIKSLKASLGVGDNHELKLRLIDLIVEQQQAKKLQNIAVPPKQDAKRLQNIRPREARTPQQQNTRNSNSTQVINMLAQLVVRGMISRKALDEAKAIAQQQNSSKKLSSYLQSLSVFAPYSQEDDAVLMINQSIVAHNIMQLQAINPSYNVSAAGNTVLDTDLAVIVAKVTNMQHRSSQVANSDEIMRTARDLHAHSPAAFLKYRRDVDNKFASYHIVDLLETNPSFTNAARSNIRFPLFKLGGLDSDVMKWTVQETFNVFVQKNASNSNAPFESLLYHLQQFIQALDSIQDDILVQTVRDKISEWTQNLESIYELNRVASMHWFMEDPSKTNIRSMTWEQIRQQFG